VARRRRIESFPPLSPPVFQVLVALSGEALHGWAIMKEVSASTRGEIELSPGTLYGLIKRLLCGDFIAESDRRPPSRLDDARRRYYELTDTGRLVVQAEMQRMEKALALAVSKRIRPAHRKA